MCLVCFVGLRPAYNTSREQAILSEVVISLVPTKVLTITTIQSVCIFSILAAGTLYITCINCDDKRLGFTSVCPYLLKHKLSVTIAICVFDHVRLSMYLSCSDVNVIEYWMWTDWIRRLIKAYMLVGSEVNICQEIAFVGLHKRELHKQLWRGNWFVESLFMSPFGLMEPKYLSSQFAFYLLETSWTNIFLT